MPGTFASTRDVYREKESEIYLVFILSAQALPVSVLHAPNSLFTVHRAQVRMRFSDGSVNEFDRLEDRNFLSGRDRLSLRHQQFRENAILRRNQWNLHLHGFENRDRVALM